MSATCSNRPSGTSPSAKNFATLCVHLPNGQIASHVMWVDADDEHVLINTEVHRAKFKAIEPTPTSPSRSGSSTNPYRYAEVRGVVAGEVRGPEARAHIDALSQKYIGHAVQQRRSRASA